MLGVYISGHPLEEYLDVMDKNVTARSDEFVVDEEIGMAKIPDGREVVIGGMITEKTVKYTKNNQAMAFVTLEDLVGSVEVIVFPRDYEKYRDLLVEDNKVFIQGRTSVEEEKDAKLICREVHSFDEGRKELWIQFPDKEAYDRQQEELLRPSRIWMEMTLWSSTLHPRGC